MVYINIGWRAGVRDQHCCIGEGSGTTNAEHSSIISYAAATLISPCFWEEWLLISIQRMNDSLSS